MPAIPLITRIYLSWPAIRPTSDCELPLRPPPNRDLNSEICRDHRNCDLLDEIRHYLKAKDSDAGEIPIHVAVLMPVSTTSLFLL
ncbi:hypothetical protein TIFTF001_032947 [Ficus carica]|uniref:Uncharacterized protein n=1 Tax=Ficus carica TaxID=3494 RepID=A0AA88DY59_FICCA|nr:hypothetical protein TIFTF001_032947 [Ficus carica]